MMEHVFPWMNFTQGRHHEKLVADSKTIGNKQVSLQSAVDCETCFQVGMQIRLDRDVLID